MSQSNAIHLIYPVALRKESVDRNARAVNPLACLSLSLSARRAWIEIYIAREEWLKMWRRSPQGERG